MPSQNLSQARVNNPVLTNLALGLRQNNGVGQYLFPTVNVGLRAGQIISFGREQFMQYATRRSPGANTPSVTFGYTSGTYVLEDFSIEGAIPKENLEEQLATEKGWTVNGARIALAGAVSIIENGLEITQAGVARNLANYPSTHKVTLTAGSQFNDSTGNPITVAMAARAAIRSNTGRNPNTAVFSASALEAALENPFVINRLNYTGVNRAGIEDLARILRIPNIYVGDGITCADDGTISDIWGKDVIFAYTEKATLVDMGLPTYGVTYNLTGYPKPDRPYYDDNRKTWKFPYSACEKPVITSNVAGYLVKNAVA